MIKFLKRTGIIIALLIAAAFLSVKLPQIGLWFGIAFFILPVIAVFKPIPKLGLDSKGFSLALFLLVGLPTLTNSQSILKEQKTEYLTARKADNPNAYLAELKKTDQKLWLSELSQDVLLGHHVTCDSTTFLQSVFQMISIVIVNFVYDFFAQLLNHSAISFRKVCGPFFCTIGA